MERKKVTITMDPDLHAEVTKAARASEFRSFSAWTEAAQRDALKKVNAAAAK